jgi:uncharacterized protein
MNVIPIQNMAFDDTATSAMGCGFRPRLLLAIGTSQFQMCVVACLATIIHAALDHSVDFVLALVLVFGGGKGAQIGSSVGARLKPEQLRAVLGVLILAIAARLILELTGRADDLYSLALP